MQRFHWTPVQWATAKSVGFPPRSGWRGDHDFWLEPIVDGWAAKAQIALDRWSMMSATADIFVRGTVASWEISRNRGVLVADAGGLEVSADGDAFDGFSTTVFPGLACEFKATKTPSGVRAVHVRPVSIPS